MAEREKGSERIINFYDPEVPFQINRNFKLATIRKDDPKYHGFKVFEKVTGKCQNENIELMIWGVEESIPLNKIDPVVMALDGFLSVDQAVNDLKIYPGYAGITKESPMTLIGHIGTYNAYNFKNGLSQLDEITQQRNGKSLAEVVRNPKLQDIIKPSIAYWFHFRGGNAEDWLEFFVKNNLLDMDSYKKVLAYGIDGKPKYFGRKIFGNSKTSEFLLTHPFYDGSGSQDADWDYQNLYLPFVMGDLSQITVNKFHHSHRDFLNFK